MRMEDTADAAASGAQTVQVQNYWGGEVMRLARFVILCDKSLYFATWELWMGTGCGILFL